MVGEITPINFSVDEYSNVYSLMIIVAFVIMNMLFLFRLQQYQLRNNKILRNKLVRNQFRLQRDFEYVRYRMDVKRNNYEEIENSIHTVIRLVKILDSTSGEYKYHNGGCEKYKELYSIVGNFPPIQKIHKLKLELESTEDAIHDLHHLKKSGDMIELHAKEFEIEGLINKMQRSITREADMKITIEMNNILQSANRLKTNGETTLDPYIILMSRYLYKGSIIASTEKSKRSYEEWEVFIDGKFDSLCNIMKTDIYKGLLDMRIEIE